MSEPPIYGNLEEAPIYGNLEEFTNIYSDEDFEAAAARIDLPALPPKPQQRASPKPKKQVSPKLGTRASWISNRISSGFQGISMSTKDETRNDKSSNKRKKPKQKVVRKEQKEVIELASPAHKADPPNAPSLNSTSSKTLNQAPEPMIPNSLSKCLITSFVVLLLISGAGVVVYFRYGREIMCFIGYGECRNDMNDGLLETEILNNEQIMPTDTILTTIQEKGNASWSDWENWSRCSNTCDGGIQRRTRICNTRNSGANCGADGSRGMETKSCNQQTCPVDAKWLSWGPYTKCSKLCGTGEKTRTRKCSPPKHGGKSCSELFKRNVDRDKKLCNKTPCKVCKDDDWTYNEENDNCYLLINQEFDWIASKKHCQQLDANLVSIHSEKEMEFLKNELIVGINGYIWIGAHEIDGDWNWQDGSKFDWTNWEKTQPNSPRWADGINDCAYLWGKQDFKWADAKCNDEYSFHFICMH